jgi:hypothetical protein
MADRCWGESVERLLLDGLDVRHQLTVDERVHGDAGRVAGTSSSFAPKSSSA